MNILPKKRWHVRTKENIARVRKDEAEAEEKERQEKLRIENADREARLNILKHKSKQKLLEAGVTQSTQEAENATDITEHINLFSDLEHAVKTSNKEHDTELKEKKEDYEKKIGYLTYLGQDTNEALGKKNWYEVAPGSTRTSEIKDTYEKLVLKDEDGKPKNIQLDIKNGEIGWKSKQKLDPINAFKKYCHDTQAVKKDQSKQKHLTTVSSSSNKYERKKYKNNKDEKKDKLLKLREARLKREKEEKCRTELFLTKLNGEPITSRVDTQNNSRVKPKYNSQFNPELARQNYR